MAGRNPVVASAVVAEGALQDGLGHAATASNYAQVRPTSGSLRKMD
jgi:hypothetical protein